MERVCVFIDGSNFYFALKKNNLATRVDYHQLSKLLVGVGRALIRTYYYNATFDAASFPDKAKSQQSFFDSLDRTPYLELRLGRIVQNREGGRMEKGVDVKMASDMVYYAARDFYDTAIVITEDQDFAPAISLVKELGKHVEIVTFGGDIARELTRVADKPLDLKAILTTSGAKESMFPQGAEEPAPVTRETLDQPPGQPGNVDENVGNR